MGERMTPARVLAAAGLVLVFLTSASVALAAGRVALVVSNSTYSHIARLPNPRPASPASCPSPTSSPSIGDANQADAICDRPAPRRAPHRAVLQLDATDTPRPEDPYAGDDISIPTPACAPAARSRPAPARRQSRRGRPAYGSRRRHGKRARYAGG